MKFVKKENSSNGLYDIYLIENKKSLKISLSDTNDIYWQAKVEDSQDDFIQFTVDKSNYELYSLFELIYSSVDKIQIKSPWKKYRLYENYEHYIETQDKLKNKKENYQENNTSHYNELYDEMAKTITWHTDHLKKMVMF